MAIVLSGRSLGGETTYGLIGNEASISCISSLWIPRPGLVEAQAVAVVGIRSHRLRQLFEQEGIEALRFCEPSWQATKSIFKAAEASMMQA